MPPPFQPTVDRPEVRYIATGTEGLLTDLSHGAEIVLGPRWKEFLGQPFTTIFHPSDRERAQQFYAELLNGTLPLALQDMHLLQADGPPCLLSFAHCPYVVDGQIVGVHGVGREPMPQQEQAPPLEHARLLTELQESKRRYRALFEDTSDAIAIVRLDHTVIDINRAMERLLGWSRQEAIGLSFYIALTPAGIALAEERERQIQAGKKISSLFEHEFVRKDGSTVWVEGRTRFVTDETGAPVGFQGTYRDITERKTLERQRADFLAMLTHDIKNPLTVIVGYAEMLLEAAKAASRQEDAPMLERLHSNALAAQSLVLNYLDLTQIEAGRLTLAHKPLTLNTLLQRVTQRYDIEARHRQLALALDLQDEIPTITGDSLALERVFANLLHNALNFTPPSGQVTVRSSRRQDEAVISITDTGPGITPEEAATLFERYQRRTTRRSPGGTGLGLFIVKALVEAHGGRVAVRSTVGRGSQFFVYLPLVGAEREGGKDAPSSA